MSYTYSMINRLEKPHNYMYTTFHGETFLHSYQSSRMAVRCTSKQIKEVNVDHILVISALPILETLFNAISLEGSKRFRILLSDTNPAISKQTKIEDSALTDLAKELENLTITDSVKTLDLLHRLIAKQLTNSVDVRIKTWLDRLVQRFEVTKKLYEVYPSGFRKGEGENTLVRLYWLFALALSLFYLQSNNLKYLNTLLKVCDLLCSLPEDLLQEYIPEYGLSVVIAAEVLSVQLLAEKKGISFASN